MKISCPVVKVLTKMVFRAVVPNLLGTRGTSFMDDNFSITGVGWEAWFQHSYYALYFYYYCIVIYKEMIIQYTIMQKQWEP